MMPPCFQKELSDSLIHTLNDHKGPASTPGSLMVVERNEKALNMKLLTV